MEEDNNKLSSQIDFLERYLKGKNVEICVVSLQKVKMQLTWQYR